MEMFSLETLQAVYALAAGAEALSRRVLEALEVIEGALSAYGEEQVAITFNGGKDCTVLVHLYAAVLVRRRAVSASKALNGSHSSNGNSPDIAPSNSSSALSSHIPPIRSIYVTCKSPFKEVEDFVHESIIRYNLRMTRIGGGMKEALRIYLEGSLEEKPAGQGVEAILVGTRRGDPHGATLAFKQATDPGWPKLIRVHPIINWTYQDVWEFLRLLRVPYCSLYDEGYTSLGSTFNTFRNPALQDGSSLTGWKPAYELTDESLERAGRGTTDPASLKLGRSPNQPIMPSTTPVEDQRTPVVQPPLVT
jgi:FAD synthetase